MPNIRNRLKINSLRETNFGEKGKAVFMKIKNLQLVAIMATILLVLTGCGNQSRSSEGSGSKPATSTISNNHKDNNKKIISDDKDNKDSKINANKSNNNDEASTDHNNESNSNDKQSSALWNTTKDQKLESFINKWAPTMNQTYTKYDGVHSLKTVVGTVYPDDLSKVSLNNTSLTVGWNESGKNEYDYNVVAIYDHDSDTTTKHITYFFSFHNGRPIALVDQTTNGTPVLVQTKNQDVQSNFEKIANGD